RGLLEEEGIKECRSLKRLLCGGEPLTVEMVKKARKSLGLEVENLYGPTEATIDSTYWRAEKGQEYQVIPIGRPIGNARAYLMNLGQEIVPPGLSGELYISGEGL